MEATCGSALKFSVLTTVSKPNSAMMRLNQRGREECMTKTSDFLRKTVCTHQRRFDFGQFSISCNHSHALALQSEKSYPSSNEDWLLKSKAQEVTSRLNGRSIFLIGMMGSGKTTVGRILSETLGYSFTDSDRHVELAMGETSVTQIFEERGEIFFRYHESEALRELSLVSRQVVATGGGAAVRPINWKYMRQGITVFLNVPLDALARRIAAVGSGSRPLLNFKSGDTYTKAFVELFTLTKKRSQAYENADVTVNLLDLAANMNLEDVCDITPTAVAIEVLTQVDEFLRGKRGNFLRMYS